MADPRFFKNLWPFTLAQICEKIGSAITPGADGAQAISDLADLGGAVSAHLTFFSCSRKLRDVFAASGAGVCLIPKGGTALAAKVAPSQMTLVEAPSVQAAFAAVARLLYQDYSQPVWSQAHAISPDARLGKDVQIAPGVVIGPGAEIGNGTRLAPRADMTIPDTATTHMTPSSIGSCVGISRVNGV